MRRQLISVVQVGSLLVPTTIPYRIDFASSGVDVGYLSRRELPPEGPRRSQAREV